MSRPYLIEAHDYRRTSAGVRALHYLCHRLRQTGYDAFVTSPRTNPLWNEGTADEAMIREIARDGIVVYPEVEDGNPLGARRVVRYLLNIPGRIRAATFTENELTFYYCGLLRPWATEGSHELFIPVVDREVFGPYTPPRWQGDNVWRKHRRYEHVVLKWIGKERDRRQLPETEHAIKITLEWPSSARHLAGLFHLAGRFYSYDPYTALVIESRLCECPTVVIPNLYWDAETYDRYAPGGLDGLAWGATAQQIERAQRTLSAFPRRYQAYCERFESQISRFIHETQRWKP